jgi:hypothetical protein
VRAHELSDLNFAAQVREAEAEGAQLLHDVCWKRVTEGDLEPVYWQGKIVAHVRKFDTRLQIEFLRAYMPERFKTPGQAQVNIGVKSSILTLTEEERQQLIAANRRVQERFAAERNAHTRQETRALPAPEPAGGSMLDLRPFGEPPAFAHGLGGETMIEPPAFAHGLGGETMMGCSDCAQLLRTKSFSAAHMMPRFGVYDEAGNVIERDEHAGEFKEPRERCLNTTPGNVVVAAFEGFSSLTG